MGQQGWFAFCDHSGVAQGLKLRNVVAIVEPVRNITLVREIPEPHDLS